MPAPVAGIEWRARFRTSGMRCRIRPAGPWGAVETEDSAGELAATVKPMTPSDSNPAARPSTVGPGPGPGRTTSVLVRAPHDLQVVRTDVPDPGPGEALVEVVAAGICGSDVELLDGTRPAAYVSYPVIPGHEWSGRVVRLGPAEDGADPVRVGDPVVAQGIRNCGWCARCREGATNLCSTGYAETGFTHPGAFSGYVLVPARLLYRLDRTVDLTAAALLEPSACVAEALLAASPLVGARTAVVGTGTLSLVAVQLLARAGAREVTVIGDSPSGRELAASWGATGFVGSEEAASPGWSCEADYVFEAAGRPTSARYALAAARRGGTVVLEGIPGDRADGDLTEVVLKHLDVRGVFGASAAAWEHVVALYNAGLLELEPLVSHTFGLREVDAAFELLRARTGGVRKVLLRPE